MNADLARRFATSTLGHVEQEYPNGLGIWIDKPTLVEPSKLHPVFYGSFDWHSCVHGWWQLHRLARLYPELQPDVYQRADFAFTAEKLSVELAYIQANPSFERPYGWGWFLALHHEVSRAGLTWEVHLRPIADLLSQRFQTYLPRLSYPVRAGTHANTAFALIHALAWASKHDQALESCIRDWTKSRFSNDIAAPHLEPSGEDFLSPTLTEALLMARVLPFSDFNAWYQQYLPIQPKDLLLPVLVSDRSDGRIGHLDGLNLSRAWCWRELSKFVAVDQEAISKLLESALPHLEANYMSEHWLCSFALLALTED